MHRLFTVRRAGATVALFAVLRGAAFATPAAPVSAIKPAADPAYGAIQSLARRMTFDWAKTHPLTATEEGLTDEDAMLDTPSLAQDARDLHTIRQWEHELRAIPLAHATLVDRDDVKLLRAQLISMERQYTVYQSDRKDYSAPGQAIVGAVFTQFEHLPVAGTNGATASDVATAWDNIIARLNGAPAYITAGEKLVTRPGRLYGTVGSEELAGAPDFLGGALTAAAKAQLSANAFARFTAGRDATLAALGREKAYIDTHVRAWHDNYAMGRAAYDAMLRDEQLIPFDSADIERMARDELARGWAEQAWDVDLARQRRTPIGPASGGGIAPGGKALVGYYRDRIAELQRFVTKHNVVAVPTWLGSVQVVETPKFLQPVSPGASMSEPQLFSRDATGFYNITPPKSLTDAARTLDPNEDFDRDRILETGAHEAMPGHFLQGSIARRHPDFVRKIQGSGVFAEGWAFYGEEMFWQLGLYDDHDLDARYDAAQWERVRGARAIVDPELASGDWSYDRAVKFFAKETGFPIDQAKAAVAGIALGPGYVISYTVGRFQLESLLGDYLERAGSKASLYDFHTRLLCYGTTPFAVVAPELLADLDKPLADVRAGAGY
jgi:hypothetical protein